jgi:hypothetical protein
LLSPVNPPESIEASGNQHQIEMPIEPEIKVESPVSEVHKLLLSCSERIDQQQNYLNYLYEGHLDLNKALSQYSSNFTEGIEAIKQQIMLLEKGVIKVYQHLEKDNTGKELKSGQQFLRKAIETNQKKNASNNASFNWKQIAIIMVSTAIISSLCSLIVFQLASNWKTDQPQNPVEKPLKPKTRKNSN